MRLLVRFGCWLNAHPIDFQGSRSCVCGRFYWSETSNRLVRAAVSTEE